MFADLKLGGVAGRSGPFDGASSLQKRIILLFPARDSDTPEAARVPRGTLSVPVAWRELASGSGGALRAPDRWDVTDVERRLASLRSDPWRDA